LYREKYFDINVRHFHEKLSPEHGIERSYRWGKEGAARNRAGEKTAREA
jgi:hypothetical protein